ncbi:MAG: hypothetical protein OXO50_02055 [Caldilineaceae bacterium]|nr:hypothetical protein [Caldilineaceae bacterium]
MRVLLILLPLVLSGCGALRGADLYHPPLTPVAERTYDEWLELSEDISYDDLTGYWDSHLDAVVNYRGRILEVFATTDDTRFRVAVTYDEAWQDEIFLRLKETEAGIAKGDVISFVGRVNGLVTYQSVLGQELTIPDITIYALQVE